MSSQTYDRKQVGLFLLVAFAFSWIFWIPNALVANGIALPAALTDFLDSPLNPAAFGPLVAAFLLTFLKQGGKGVLGLLKRGFSLRFKKSWLLAILLLPMVLFGGAIFAAILTGARALDLSIISNPPFALVAFFVILLTAGPLQEEFGWRGYLLPHLLNRYNALGSSLIVGFFWWLWHLPAVFIPGKFMADNLLVFLGLLVVISLTSILFTWVYNNTNGSILAAMLMHACMNWSIWAAMPDMKMDLTTIGFISVFLGIAVVLVIRKWGAARLSQDEG